MNIDLVLIMKGTNSVNIELFFFKIVEYYYFFFDKEKNILIIV